MKSTRNYFKSYKHILLMLFITAWPFLNFYSSKTNAQLIYIKNFIVLYIALTLFFILTFKIFEKYFKIKQERTLIIYSVFTFLFFNYKKSWDVLINIKMLADLPHKSLLYLLVGILTLFLSLKFSKNEKIQKFFPTFIIVLFSFSLIECFHIFYSHKTVEKKQKSKTLSYNFKNKPNIYFFLLDAYAGADALKENEKFDNSDFINFLQKNNFIVAGKAYSNYTETVYSLSATFKMDYIGHSDVNYNDILSPDKEAFRILKENEYQIVMVPCYYAHISGRNVANLTITNGKFFNIIFNNLSFLKTTCLQAFEGLARPLLYVNTNNVTELLKIKSKGSRFVYLHFLSLHDDAYDKKGNVATRLGGPKLPYSHHVASMNPTIKESINQIITHDPTAIIIVQGDHGPLEWRKENNDPTTFNSFRNIFSVISAMRIPDIYKEEKTTSYLKNSPTPVNNFRIIFSLLSRTPAELLPDRQFALIKTNFKELTSFRFQDKRQ